jgi:elongation factor 4
LNLIDTPGHVDFSSEVSRSLIACQGVILLVDANQGVQAQTVSNFFMAFANNLTVVPVLNKIDLPNSNPALVKEQLMNLFEIDPSDVILASAKMGIGIKEIFDAVINRIPPPVIRSEFNSGGIYENKKCFILQDSWYDHYRGTVNLVQVVSDTLRPGDIVQSAMTNITYTVKTLGILTPDEVPVSSLHPGQVGIMTCNMKSPRDALIGDTYHAKDIPVKPIIEIKRPHPMVFAGVYPFDTSEFVKLKDAIEKVCLNDYSVTAVPETSAALGLGWRIGFLGLLHLEVFTQRLEDEYSAEVLITTPSVPYKIRLKKQYKGSQDLEDIVVNNPSKLPERNKIETYFEPIVRGTLICPQEYVGTVYGLASDCRGEQLSMESIDQVRTKLEFLLPLNEIVVNFFDRLKSITSGYGSFDYEDAGYRETTLNKIDILLNDECVQELTCIVHTSRAREKGKELVLKLKESLPRQQFTIKIQAVTGSKVLARDDIKAYKKDVTAKCYGGDVRRKMKLLAHQAEGKARLKSIGKIEVSKDTFVKLLT